MKRMAVFLIATLSMTGCATTTGFSTGSDLKPGSGSKWEAVAFGAALMDVGSTGGALEKGFQEANPIYGSSPSSEEMLAVNLGLHAGLSALTRSMDPESRRKTWRTIALIRLLAAGWNLSQNGCACFSFSF